MTRCDSFYLHEEVAYRCAFSGHDDESDHMALTRSWADQRRVEERWAVLVWTTEMADEGFDR